MTRLDWWIFRIGGTILFLLIASSPFSLLAAFYFTSAAWLCPR